MQATLITVKRPAFDKDEQGLSYCYIFHFWLGICFKCFKISAKHINRDSISGYPECKTDTLFTIVIMWNTFMDKRVEGVVSKKSATSRRFPISGTESGNCCVKNFRSLAGESSASKSVNGMKSVMVHERSWLGRAIIMKAPLGHMCRWFGSIANCRRKQQHVKMLFNLTTVFRIVPFHDSYFIYQEQITGFWEMPRIWHVILSKNSIQICDNYLTKE